MLPALAPLAQVPQVARNGCPQCGGTRFKAATAKPRPNDPVTCGECGTSIDLAAEKQRLEREARAAVEDRLRNKPS